MYGRGLPRRRMSIVAALRRIALAAVLLFVLGCSEGNDRFEPAPGASLELGELDRLLDAALVDFDLQREPIQPQTLPDNGGGYSSCFEVESGPCSVPRAPGVVVSLRGENGALVLIQLMLGIDAMEVGDLVQSATQSRRLEATETLRVIYESAPVPETRVTGPCDQSADRTSDEGCAWGRRDAPNVGDEARAMKSDSLGFTRLSAVAFARESLFADVQVITADGDVPNGLADDLAEALDEQIKLALSQ